jgi:hypothetical protein
MVCMGAVGTDYDRRGKGGVGNSIVFDYREVWLGNFEGATVNRSTAKKVLR